MIKYRAIQFITERGVPPEQINDFQPFTTSSLSEIWHSEDIIEYETGEDFAIVIQDDDGGWRPE